MMLMFIITENIYDNLLQPAKVVWQRIIQLLAFCSLNMQSIQTQK